MENLIVFGAYGFIGFNFLLEIHAKHKYNLFFVDDPSNYACANYRESYNNINCNMVSEQEVLEAFKDRTLFHPHSNKTHIVNFIGASHNDRAILDMSVFEKTNITAMKNLSRVYLSLGNPGKLIHLSTDEVYGQTSTPDRKFSELQTPEPHNPYSETKYIGEHLLRQEIPDCIVLRPSNQYGKYQYPEKLIPHNIQRAIHNKNLIMYSEGNQFRTWTPVEYTTKVISNLLESNKYKLYNICYPDDSFIVSNRAILEHISNHFYGSLSNNISRIHKIKDPRGDLHDYGYSLDITNLQREDWFEGLPKYSFFDYLDKTIEYYKASDRFKKIYNSKPLQDFFNLIYGEIP